MTHTRPAGGQLSLPFDERSDVADPGRADRWAPPMTPGEAEAPFDDPGWFFEPWWPGTPATVVITRDGTRLVADQLGDPLTAFPELSIVPGQMRARSAAVPGTLLVLDAEGRPDPDALRRRLADPGDRSGTGAFIAADLLEHDGELLSEEPFVARRARLLEVAIDGDRFLASRGLHGEGETLAKAAASMGVGSVSARRLDAAWRPGPAPDAWLRFPVEGQPARPTRPLLVLLQRLPLD
jgi:bifunctional non-homologous end joining protein LigD